MEIKKIVVCGDSFCTSTINDRLHFSQILADKYGYNVTNLAHGSFSNVGICFQIKEAIAMKPDIIIYNIADHARFELVMNDNFNIRQGLKNIVYYDKHTTSFGHRATGNTDSPIFATNYGRLFDTPTVKITADHKEAIKTYFKYFYSYDLNIEIDRWMFGYWHQQIINNNIIPICVAPNTKIGQPMYDYSMNNPTHPAYYHTDSKTQEIVANNIAKELKILLN